VKAEASAGGLLFLTVTDNGPGVPEAIKERIFDPFFSTKGSRGTGLGLAVTRKIVMEHGGALNVRDAEGGGAVFEITLPGSAGEGSADEEEVHPLLA
jgi:two-component system sensor histidine kinase AtoS